MEIHPVLLNWIANFLTDRQQRTRVGHFFPEWKFLNADVPQGTKLGPLLFLIMISDLAVADETVKFVDTSLWEIISNNSPSQLPANIISCNLVPRACDPREGTRGSGIIRCRKPGILAKIELRIPFQRPIRFLPETDYPRASRSFPRIAGSGNEIASAALNGHRSII